MRVLLSSLFLLLSSCSHIDRQVEGWPQDLKKTEVLTGFWEVQAKCWDDMPLLWKLSIPIVFACTVVDLDAGTCIVYRWQEKLSEDLYEHEDKHCKGGAHDDGLQEYFDAWRKKNSSAAAK